MEFKSLRNIESSFRQIRLFGIVFLSLCAVVTVWSVWNSYRFAEKQREKIYVLDVTRNFAASLFRNIKYFTLRKLYLCRKWMQKRLQKTIKTGITLPNFDFLA